MSARPVLHWAQSLSPSDLAGGAVHSGTLLGRSPIVYLVPVAIAAAAAAAAGDCSAGCLKPCLVLDVEVVSAAGNAVVVEVAESVVVLGLAYLGRGEFAADIYAAALPELGFVMAGYNKTP